MSLSFTVIQRIAGGFALVLLLLIAMGITGLTSKNSINHSLGEVGDATRIRMLSQTMTIGLLEAGRYADVYYTTQDPAALPKIEENFKVTKAHLAELKTESKSRTEGDERLTKIVAEFSASADQVLAQTETLFGLHRDDVALLQPIKNQRTQLENNGDELDTLLADAIDAATDANVKSALGDLRSAAKDALTGVSDALNQDNLESARTALRESADLAGAMDTALGKLAGATGIDDAKSMAGQFIALLKGDQAPLAMHVKALDLRAQTDAAMEELNTRLDTARKHSDIMIKVAGEIVESVKSKAASTNSTATFLILLISAIAIAVSAGVAFWVIKSIRTPLARIVDVLKIVSSGDFTQRADITSKDEFGELAANVNELTHRLRGMIRNIAGSSVQLAAAAEETSAITTQTNAGIGQQKLQTDAIATAMAQMAATVDEVARSAESTLREVKGTLDVAKNGQAVVSNNIATINNLAEEIEGAAKVITELDEYSKNIGKVLDVIRSVADQTNLLALNAAIEAARAGEHGRGFAVVADEVRTLASRTQNSTREINAMIDNLQNGVRNAVTVMDASRRETAASVEQTAEAGRALEAITRMVGVINDMSTHIASAAEEQSATTQDMHQNIVSISEIAEQTSEGAGQTAQACIDLAKLAEQLQQLVGQFKV